jgi:hypothetical protein
MKLFLSVLFALCALASLAFGIYSAIPIFPYVNDPTVIACCVAFLLFYYLAYRANNSNKTKEEELT